MKSNRELQGLLFGVSEIADLFEDRLGANALAFLRRVYAKGMSDYETRIRACGMTNLGRVLDAGCGFGQWTLALALLNQRVYAVDVSAVRVGFLEALACRVGFPNIKVRVSSLESLPYRSAFFNGVFCYGVVFLTDWKASLRELSRVLKPGGRLYVNANGMGWYKRLWYDQPNRASDYDPRRVAALTLWNTWKYEHHEPLEAGGDLLIEPREMESFLREIGFCRIEIGAEGSLRVRGFRGRMPAPFFDGTYRGDTGVYEVMAVKGRRP
jgi:SAM-dependent methyltransferase